MRCSQGDMRLIDGDKVGVKNKHGEAIVTEMYFNQESLKLKPNIYTKNYYKKLDEMNETEISNYLNDNPLPINQHGFLSGRHRVAAMIGRILRGEKYIPFNVYKT